MSYEDNFYNWLKRNGYADHFEHAGIYCIKVDGQIAYVGKSMNMLRRLAQHFVGVQLGTEKKYRILDELRRNGHSVNFEVLYFATEQNYDAIVEEIGMKEGEFIRQYRPILNTQIPNENDWRKYEKQSVDARKILEDML